MKKLLLISGIAALGLTLTNCGASTSTAGAGSNLTTAGKMSSGLGSSISTIQNVGGAMGSNGTFALSMGQRNQSTLAATSKCSSHAEPGFDTNANGVIDNGERYSQGNDAFALQKFYCVLAADTTGPESVAGSLSLLKTVICAVEKQIGTLAFDGVARPISSLVLDLTCATQPQIDSMTGTTGQSSVTLPVAATVTAALNPTFTEVPSNTHYSHGIRIVSNDGTSLLFVILAKFDSTVTGNPVESGNFEFATLGSGTMMQGTAIETTAGKISGGTSTTKHLWYEARSNRLKASNADPVCPGTTGSCGFTRHTRLSTDISFSGGEISNVSNLYGIMSDGSDDFGNSGQNDQMTLITATGSLSTGLTGKIWGSTSDPITLGGGSTIAALTAGVTTCIPSAGAAVTSTCPGGMPAASTKAGLGFSGAATMADQQFVNP